MRTISLWILFFYCGATAAANVLPQDTKDFRELIEREVPLGTPIKVAKDRMEALGLACNWSKGGWTNNINDQTGFYSCERRAGNIVLTRWQVSMLPKHENVAAIRASVGLVGP